MDAKRALIEILLEDDFEEDVVGSLISSGLIDISDSSVLYKTPRPTQGFTGNPLIKDILNGHPDRGYSYFRMTNTMFFQLGELLVSRGLLKDSRCVSAHEQLACFLYGVGHGVANRVLAETFKHSGETISRHFNNVLKAIVSLKDEFIIQPSSSTRVHPRIKENKNFYPFFMDALGAVDGIHIPALVKNDEQPRYRNSKGFTSQNVVAASSFDNRFLFVCTGWEGSTTDMKVLRCCTEDGAFKVPEGKFYLVDLGFANTDKFLAPYKGIRYHLSTFQQNNVQSYANPKDLYNHRHAQLRNAIEDTFRILKRRFKILRSPIVYPFKVQHQIVMACCVIHNFIWRSKSNDKYFNTRIELEPIDEDEDDIDPTVIVGPDELFRGHELRHSITMRLWNESRD